MAKKRKHTQAAAPVIPPVERQRAARLFKAGGRAMPTTAELAEAVRKDRYRRRFRAVLRSTLYTLVVVAAISILVATLWMPVLEIYGNSMTPTLSEGEIVVSRKGDFRQGDVVAFYYGNKLLVKRVIAGPGEWVNIEDDGTVTVNGERLAEPYVSELALGDCNIELPYQVPADKYFLMGDHRATSVDSRNKSIGAVSKEQIVGTIVFCVWPLAHFGPLS